MKIVLNSRAKQNDATGQHKYRNAAHFVTNVTVYIILHIQGVPSQPAQRTVTYRQYYTNSFSTCTTDGHTTPDAVLMQFDDLMMSTVLVETCRGL